MNEVYARPYRARARARRASSLGAWVVAVVVAWPMAQAIDGRFAAAGDPAALAAALQAVWLRVGTVVLCWVGLAAHGAVLRGEARPVWSLLPVDPAAVVRQEMALVARQSVPVTASALLALAPTAWRAGFGVWGIGALGLGIVALAALVWSTLALLGAVSAAEDPRFEGLLDALRGRNPRPQAAILWALAPVVFGVGLAMGLVAEAVGEASLGLPATPWARVAGASVLLLGAAALPAVSRRSWLQATPVLEEIRARYAAVERPEHAGRVALDGQAPRVPAPIRPWFLHEARLGWREHRGAVNSAWAVAVLAAVAGWTADPTGPARAAWLAAGIGLWPGRVPVVGAASEAPWLRVWLADRPSRRAWARVLVVMGWTATPLMLPVVAVGLRAGLSGAGLVLAAGVVGGALAAGLSVAWSARRRVAGYTASALVAASALLAASVGGLGG